MWRFLVRLFAVICTVFISIVVLIRVGIGLLAGIILCLLTGWHWWVVLPICAAIAVLTVFGEEGFADGDGTVPEWRKKQLERKKAKASAEELPGK